MKTVIRKVHSCDFCGKKLLVGKAMEKHEDLCRKNPENKGKCYGCKNLVISELEQWYTSFDGDSDCRMTGRPVFFCKKRNNGIHTIVFWKKYFDEGHSIYGREAFVNGEGVMPKETDECEFFEKGEPENLFK